MSDVIEIIADASVIEVQVGAIGPSAYTVAVENGFTGSIGDWLISLRGDDGADGLALLPTFGRDLALSGDPADAKALLQIGLPDIFGLATELAGKATPGDVTTAITSLNLGSASTKTAGLGAGNVLLLDGSGKVDPSTLPAVAINDTFVVASQSAMLALTAEKGDIAVRSDLNKSYILSSNSPGTLADWKELLTPTDAVLSVAGQQGAITAAALKAALSLAIADVGSLQTSLNGKQPLDTTLSSLSGQATAAYGIGLLSTSSVAALTASLGGVTTSVAGTMSAADKTKLNGVASGATANAADSALRDRSTHTGTQSADSLIDGTTNKAFLASERTKLTAIAAGATANAADTALRDRTTHTGTQSADTLTDGTSNKAFLATERTKLSGVAAGATANDTDVNLKSRANHTGTQALATITGAGDAAGKNTGTTSGTLAAGDDSRITGAAQKNLANLFADRQDVSHPFPAVGLSVSGQAVDGRLWEMIGAGNQLILRTANGAYTSFDQVFVATRSGSALTSVNFPGSLKKGGVDVATLADLAGGGQDKGAWNASTNSPALTSTSPADPKQKYTVSVAGTSSGPTGSSVAYKVGDQLYSTNGGAWTVVPFSVPAGSIDTTSLSATVQSTINGKAGQSSPLFVLQGGAEGGEIRLEKPATGTSLAAEIVVDLSGDDFRIYENGGTFRGIKLPIGGLTGGIGTTFLFSNSQYTPPWTGARPAIGMLAALFTKDKFATWNIDGSGASDASTNVQRALQASADDGYTWEVPAVLMRLDNPITLTGRSRMRGCSPVRQHTNIGAPTANEGTYFIRNHTGKLFSTSGAGGNAAASPQFEGFGVYRAHPAPSGGVFTPTDDDFDFYFLNLEPNIKDAIFIGSTRAVFLKGGRLVMEGVAGQCWKRFVEIPCALDIVDIHRTNLWPFYSDAAAYQNYTLSNLQALRLGRVDNPRISSFFSIFHRSIFSLFQFAGETGFPGGSLSHANAYGIGSDSANMLIEQDAGTDGGTLSIYGAYHVSSPSAPANHAISMGGTNHVIDAYGIRMSALKAGAFYAGAGAGGGSFTNSIIDEWNKAIGGHACYTANGSTRIDLYGRRSLGIPNGGPNYSGNVYGQAANSPL